MVSIADNGDQIFFYEMAPCFVKGTRGLLSVVVFSGADSENRHVSRIDLRHLAGFGENDGQTTQRRNDVGGEATFA